MPDLLNMQGLLVLVGALLLLAPAAVGALTIWIKNIVFKAKDPSDNQIATVVKLLELKTRLEHEGCTVAASTTKDLVYAVVYGQKPPKKEE
jgi:hypothetical protein